MGVMMRALVVVKMWLSQDDGRWMAHSTETVGGSSRWMVVPGRVAGGGSSGE